MTGGGRRVQGLRSGGPEGVRRPGGVGSGLAEQGGEGGDGFVEQRADAGLLVCEAPGTVVGDRAAVLGFEGELADPGGHGRVNGRAARVASRG
jgi:hypothetical protein